MSDSSGPSKEPSTPSTQSTPSLNLARVFLEDRLSGPGECGDRLAIHTEQGSYSYRDVALRARRFARLLRAVGVRCEERVLLALPDGVDMVAALFGTLELGAVVVMVNPELSQDAYSYFCASSRARAIISTRDCLETFGLASAAGDAGHLLGTIKVDDPGFEQRLAATDPIDHLFETHPDDPAIWLFSGGTTGHPKAVVQSHQSFVNTTRCYAESVVGYRASDVTLSVPKLFFGYATGSNLFFPFSVGASVVLFPERCTAERLFDLIERFRPTILINVPTMIGKLLSAPDAAQRDLSSLRLSTSAGEALPEDLYRRWREAFGCEILDGLGTAEMWHIFLSNHPGSVKPGSLGHAVRGFEVRVRDDQGNDLPAGEIGWLWVRGDSRALQYWQRREQSRFTFRGDWVVSGDMLRKESDGTFTYCGRGDDMIKVSGKWLSPKEVENCLSACPGTEEVAVVAIDDAAGLPKPWAFVIASDEAAASTAFEERLRAWAQERLEHYKVPRQIRCVDSLPRTHLGKVDRGRLRANHCQSSDD